MFSVIFDEDDEGSKSEAEDVANEELELNITQVNLSVCLIYNLVAIGYIQETKESL
jgi:hypothetical protein